MRMLSRGDSGQKRQKKSQDTKSRVEKKVLCGGPKHNRQWWRGEGSPFQTWLQVLLPFFSRNRGFFPFSCNSLLCSPLLAPGEVFFYLEEKKENGKPRKPGWLIRRRRFKAQKRKMSRKVVLFYTFWIWDCFFQFSGNRSASVRARMSQSKKRREGGGLTSCCCNCSTDCLVAQAWRQEWLCSFTHNFFSNLYSNFKVNQLCLFVLYEYRQKK